MSSSLQDIQKIGRSRLKELQQLELEQLELRKKTSIDVNFNTLNNILDEKKTSINKNNYAKSHPLAKWYDEQLITRLEAILNSLKILDKRVSKLEKKLSDLK